MLKNQFRTQRNRMANDERDSITQLVETIEKTFCSPSAYMFLCCTLYSRLRSRQMNELLLISCFRLFPILRIDHSMGTMKSSLSHRHTHIQTDSSSPSVPTQPTRVPFVVGRVHTDTNATRELLLFADAKILRSWWIAGNVLALLVAAMPGKLSTKIIIKLVSTNPTDVMNTFRPSLSFPPHSNGK